MNCLRSRLRDLEALATVVGFSSKALAAERGVSLRTLARFIRRDKRSTLKSWLLGLRWRRALELLGSCGSVKAAAYAMGYGDPSHYGRDFKRLFGRTPGSVWKELRATPKANPPRTPPPAPPTSPPTPPNPSTPPAPPCAEK